MQSNNGGIKNLQPITKVSLCKQCLKTKRYATTSLCYGCWKMHEREKRAKKKEAALLRKVKSRERKANKPSKLKKNLDIVFSQYIRRRAADRQGNIVCVCCGRSLPWQEAQNMHYVGRAHMNTRWDEKNCYPGCVRCNVMLNGNYPAYTKYLLNTYGAEWLQKLIKDGEQIKQWTTDELKTEIEKYQKLIKTL